MDKEITSKTVVRPEVFKKLNPESILVIERGLFGDLPEKLKPKVPGLVRGRPEDLTIAKPTSVLSSCIPIAPDSPGSDPGRKSLAPEDDEVSPLKKSFSFRDKFSRMNIFGKDKGPKVKWRPGTEQDAKDVADNQSKADQDKKGGKRLWFFKNKDGDKLKSPSSEKKYLVNSKKPMYKRSKSFEFLPRAADEDYVAPVDKNKHMSYTKNRYSQIYGSNESENEGWLSSESFEGLTIPTRKISRAKESFKYLENVKEQGPGSTASSKSHTSSISTVGTSNASGLVDNIFHTESVQNLLEEFDKAVEMFSENYLSDCEPYTRRNKSKDPNVREKRKSRSFSTLPSPKIVHLNCMNVSELSEEFSLELNNVLIGKQRELGRVCELRRSARRGSVTDWCVLEEQPRTTIVTHDKYRRAQKKPMNRVRRISSTKYQVLAPPTGSTARTGVPEDINDWITPEECSVFRDPRPPLVIPRISQHRTRPSNDRRPHHLHQPFNYAQESLHEVPKLSQRQYGLREWSPVTERARRPIDSPPSGALSKKLGGSTENILIAHTRRPSHLQLPVSSSDSLDVDVRERSAGGNRNRKSRSMVVAGMHRVKSPVPAPRLLLRTEPAENLVIHEGSAKRTKFAESGKKCRKHWTDCYLTLTPTALRCYKDQKTYQATKISKASGTPPSPTAPRVELVLPLKNAHIMPCNHQHTSRFARSVVLTVGYDQYLIQDDTKDGAAHWLELIQNVIYKLGPPMVAEYPQYQSSNTDLESLGRTPPAARHPSRSKQKAGGSSNEDLSDSTEVSYVKSKLRKFFARRPAMEVLVKKGIYKDEPVFGRNLEEVCPPASPRIPEFVVACVREIERTEENMCTDGLYRASGNLSQVQKIRLEIDQNNLSVIENSPDIHVLTGSLKLFFRELKEPLIPCKLFDRILSACSIKPRESRTKEFKEIVQTLPACNRDTLKFLLEHLLRVTTYSERNRMHTANLAIVFGPTLLWAPAEQAHNIAVDCIQQNNVVDILLTDFKEIFAEESGKSKKKA